MPKDSVSSRPGWEDFNGIVYQLEKSALGKPNRRYQQSIFGMMVKYLISMLLT